MQKVALFALLSLVSLPLWAQDAAVAEKPAEAAEKPAEAAEKPAEAAEKPADAAEKPADAAEKPAEAAEKPAEAAEKPAEAAEKPADTAEKPADTAEKPAETVASDDVSVTTFSVSSIPVGRIFLDGKDTGMDTPLVDYPITAGTHTLKVAESATGREKTVTFHLEEGNNLNLNLNLPEPEAPLVADDADKAKEGEKVADDAIGDADTAGPGVAMDMPKDDWTWMTVAGWSGLGLGAMGLLAGTVVLTSQVSDEDGPLGFGLFGAGAGMVLGGGVLIYLDSELMSDEGETSETAGIEAEKAFLPLGGLR